MTIVPPTRVAIVMDSRFGMAMADLAALTHTWVIDSPDNKTSARKVPKSDCYDSLNGIILFEADDKKFSEQQFIEVMPEIDQARAGWTAIEVYGISPTFLISDVLKSEYSIIHIEPTAGGFIATRSRE